MWSSLALKLFLVGSSTALLFKLFQWSVILFEKNLFLSFTKWQSLAIMAGTLSFDIPNFLILSSYCRSSNSGEFLWIHFKKILKSLIFSQIRTALKINKIISIKYFRLKEWENRGATKWPPANSRETRFQDNRYSFLSYFLKFNIIAIVISEVRFC